MNNQELSSVNNMIPLYVQRMFGRVSGPKGRVTQETALKRLRKYVEGIRNSDKFKQMLSELRTTESVSLDVLNEILKVLNCPWFVNSFSSENIGDLEYVKPLSKPFQSA